MVLENINIVCVRVDENVLSGCSLEGAKIRWLERIVERDVKNVTDCHSLGMVGINSTSTLDHTLT